jgi:hypothetical protein
MKNKRRQSKVSSFSPAFLILIFAFLTFPPLASAQDVGIPYWGSNPPVLSCSGQYLELGGRQPCTSVCDILRTLQRAIYFGITLVLFVLAPIMFLAGGIMVAMGGANPGILSMGKTTLWRAFIGTVIALGAFLIIATFLWLVGNPARGGVAWPQIQCNNPPGYQVNPGVFKSGYPPASGQNFTPAECRLICYDPNTECRVINGAQVCVPKNAPAQPQPQPCDPTKPAGQQGCPAGQTCGIIGLGTGSSTVGCW